MLERLAYWENEILRAPEVVVPAAIFLFVVLIGLVRGLRRRTRAVEHNGVEVEARRWVGDRINEHVDVLAEAYSEASAHAEQDELPSDFAATIESFIAEVLLRERDSEGFDVDLSTAVREFVVLHRAELYEDVINRTREYLAAA
jgi:hypothetical protein